jgi:hypothetical protein
MASIGVRSPMARAPFLSDGDAGFGRLVRPVGLLRGTAGPRLAGRVPAARGGRWRVGGRVAQRPGERR